MSKTHKKQQALEDDILKRNLRIQALNDIVTASKGLNLLLCNVAASLICNPDYWNNIDDYIAQGKNGFWLDRRKELSDSWFKVVLANYDFQFTGSHREIIFQSISASYKLIENNYNQLETLYNHLNSLLLEKSDETQDYVLSEEERICFKTSCDEFVQAVNNTIMAVDDFCRDAQNLALSKLFNFEIKEKSIGFSQFYNSNLSDKLKADQGPNTDN